MRTIYAISFIVLFSVFTGVAFAVAPALGLHGIQASLARFAIIGIGFVLVWPLFKRFLFINAKIKKEKLSERGSTSK